MVLKSFVAEMFGSSPFRPLQSHMERVQACVEQLPAFIEAAQRDDWGAAAAVQRQITDHEHEADDLKKDLRLQLPKSLFMAVDRRDLLEILAMQDKIANKAKDIAGLMLGRRMAFPPALCDQYLEFLRRGIDAVGQARQAIEELDELLETGFRGAEVQLVEALLKHLDAIEHDTDQLQIQLRASLRTVERELPPVDVMFLYKIIEWTGDLADRAQSVGSRLQILVAR
jgi:uncharacterized protein